MTDSDFYDRCPMPQGHADWAVHVLGYLKSSYDPEVFVALIEALRSAADLYQLPPVARADLEYLEGLAAADPTLGVPPF